MDQTPSNSIPSSARVRLCPGVRMQKDKISGQTMLLYPESTLELNSTGTAIVELCDGRTFDEIVAALAKRFNAPADVLRGDVSEYLIRLRDKRLVQWPDAGTT
jgi:pyrroloquinoline quinone biosynthesis protein D